MVLSRFLFGIQSFLHWNQTALHTMEIEDRLLDALSSSTDQILGELRAIKKDIYELKVSRMIIDGDLILEFSEVCTMLHMSERQVRRYREQGELVGFLLDGKRSYRHSEVQEFLKRRIEQSAGWKRNRPKCK